MKKAFISALAFLIFCLSSCGAAQSTVTESPSDGAQSEIQTRLSSATPTESASIETETQTSESSDTPQISEAECLRLAPDKEDLPSYDDFSSIHVGSSLREVYNKVGLPQRSALAGILQGEENDSGRAEVYEYDIKEGQTFFIYFGYTPDENENADRTLEVEIVSIDKIIYIKSRQYPKAVSERTVGEGVSDTPVSDNNDCLTLAPDKEILPSFDDFSSVHVGSLPQEVFSLVGLPQRKSNARVHFAMRSLTIDSPVYEYDTKEGRTVYIFFGCLSHGYDISDTTPPEEQIKAVELISTYGITSFWQAPYALKNLETAE